MSNSPDLDLTPDQIADRRRRWREARSNRLSTPEMRAAYNQQRNARRRAVRASLTAEEMARLNEIKRAKRKPRHKESVTPEKWADICVRNARAVASYKRRKRRARHKAFVDATRRAAPHNLPPDMREDVIAAVLFKYGIRPSWKNPRPSISDIPALMKDAIREYNRQASTFDYVSLDEPLPGTDGVRLIDTIEADRPHL